MWSLFYLQLCEVYSNYVSTVAFLAQRIITSRISWSLRSKVALVARQTMTFLFSDGASSMDHEFCYKPDRDATTCNDGDWDPGTRGSGEARGHYGLSTANWGGPWREQYHLHHFKELINNPCHILCLQEADERLNIELAECPGANMLIIRAPEPRDTLMMCARRSKVQGLRLEVFHRLYDGPYMQKLNANTTRRLHAMSKIMVGSVRMKDVRLRGGGADWDEDGDVDEIRIVNVHLHIETSKGRLGYNTFWDEVAKYLCHFEPRFLCGDFGTALFNVAPELRTRGFQINLAAWQCWQDRNRLGGGAMVDDIGIFRLGPCHGIQMCYNSNALGFSGWPTGSFRMLVKGEEKGDEFFRDKHHDVQPFSILFNARHFESCVCAYPDLREQFMENTFTPVFCQDAPAMTGMKTCKPMSPHYVDTSRGSFSFRLQIDAACEQKLGSFDTSSYALGSCAPLMIFMDQEECFKRGLKRGSDSYEIYG